MPGKKIPHRRKPGRHLLHGHRGRFFLQGALRLLPGILSCHGVLFNLIKLRAQSFRKRGEAVSLALGVWRTETPCSYLDRYGKRCLCTCPTGRKSPDIGRNPRKGCGLWTEGFLEHGASEMTGGEGQHRLRIPSLNRQVPEKNKKKETQEGR